MDARIKSGHDERGSRGEAGVSLRAHANFNFQTAKKSQTLVPRHAFAPRGAMRPSRA
jgi:ribosomal protein L15